MVLVPVAKNSADDAMEAMLEAMEPPEGIHENGLTDDGFLENEKGSVERGWREHQDELETVRLAEKEEIEETEEEPIKKKSGGLKGLVSGGGKDGVGKFGTVGDVIGGITDRLGVTDYGLAGASAKRKNEKQDSPEFEDPDFDEVVPEIDDYEDSQEIVKDLEDDPELTVTKQVNPQGQVQTSENIQNISKLMRTLGLENEADKFDEDNDMNAVRRILASHVGTEPRDMRLDRLLRLTLRLILMERMMMMRN